jgi:tetratricopeptide (TPR) repeat protein
MRAYVFPDADLQRFAERFVWLSLDTEREDSSPIVSKLGVRVLPTLFVIDAASEQVVLEWAGSLTASELANLLEDAELAARHRDARGDAAAALLRGHRASAAGNLPEAIADYRAALAEGPVAWPDRPQTLDALVARLSDVGSLAECVTTAVDAAPTMPAGTALADVLRTAMGCAEQLPENAPERARLTQLVALSERVVMDAAQPILADDRSDLYGDIVGALRGLGRSDDAMRVARVWSSFLEARAATARTPEERAVFDAHRLLAYVALGQPERAIPMLEQSERDFPGDYNPPARLGSAYFAMKRYDDAFAALQRALGRAYGPRKLRLWSLEADILVAKGDKVGARRALQDALAFAKTVPLTAAYPKLRDALQVRLDQMR